MTKTQIGQLFLAFFACCLLVWQMIPRSSEDETPALALHTPDWFSTDVTVIDMNENGLPKRRFEAEKVMHYPQQKMTDMLRPKFVLFHDEREPWELTSDKGRSFHGRHTSDIVRLDLWHDVILQQIEDGKSTEMRTSTIAVFPENDFAETDQAVLFMQPGQMLTGVGMRAYFADDALELFSQVRSEHAPADKS